MASQDLGGQTVACPRGHENRCGAEWCATCGMPVVDFDVELEDVLEMLSGWEKHVSFTKEKVFIGVGDQGCRLVACFHQAWARQLKASDFLLIESSGDGHALPSLESVSPPGGDSRLRPPSRHHIPGSLNKQVGYFGLGERLATADPGINDSLLKTGIRDSSRKQVMLMVAALGGGTGGGASPHTLERARALNPNCRSLVMAVMPAGDEPDSAHFNAFCSLSRFIKSDGGPLADMILLVDHERLMRLRGVDNKGEEVSNDELVSHMLAVLTGGIADGGLKQSDPGYLARMSRSMGIHAFVPCLAVGRSLEIFGNVTNILESALACPLAPIDCDSIALSFVLVQAPARIAQSIPEEKLRAELNRWNKDKFANLRGGVIQVMHSERGSDRIDVCLLLGGTKLEVAAKRAKDGFDRFRSVVESESWEKEFASSNGAVREADQAVRWYDGKLDDTGSGTEGVYLWTDQNGQDSEVRAEKEPPGRSEP